MIDSKTALYSFHKSLGGFKNDFRNRNLVDLIMSNVKGNKILDIGCGTGYLLDCLRKKKKKVFGIEPNGKLVKLSKILFPSLRIFKGYAEDLNRFNQKFETIIMIDVLEHIKNDNLIIKKVYLQLKRKGQLILVVPVYQFLYGKRDKKVGHYRRYSKTTLINKLTENKFRIIYSRYWNMLGFFPYLFFEKILGKEIRIDRKIRSERKKTIRQKIINKALNFWFKYVENNLNLGFGLSLVCIAEKKNE